MGGLKPPIAGSASRRSCLLSKYRADRSGSAVREQPVQSANEQLNERWSRVPPSKGQLGDLGWVLGACQSTWSPSLFHPPCSQPVATGMLQGWRQGQKHTGLPHPQGWGDRENTGSLVQKKNVKLSTEH